RAGDTEEARHVHARVSAAVRRLHADPGRRRLPAARLGLDRARIDHAVAGGQYRLFQAPVLRDAGDVDRAAHDQDPVRSGILAFRVLDEQRTWDGAARWDHGIDSDD